MSRRTTLFSNGISFAALAICICLANDGGGIARTSAQDSALLTLSRPHAAAAPEGVNHASEGMNAAPVIRFLPPSSFRLNYLVSHN